MAIRRFLTAMVLALALCAPSVALSEEGDSGTSTMRGSLTFGYGKVDEANSYSFDLDFTGPRMLLGFGFFWIDNGNLPSGLRDYPPPAAATTTDVGWFNDNESGGYVKLGRVLSELRLFGMLGAADVKRKYVVQSSSGINYVNEEDSGDFKVIYGGGIGYRMFNRVLVQYQYDNRRKGLVMVGVSF